jgi:hypothetical protein
MDHKYNDEDFERWRNELEDVSSDEEETEAQIKTRESKITHFVIDNLKRKFHDDFRKLTIDLQSLTALGAEIHRNSALIDFLESRTDIHCANCLLCQSCHSNLTPIQQPLINYLSTGNGNVEDRGKLKSCELCMPCIECNKVNSDTSGLKRGITNYLTAVRKTFQLDS